jgi:CBS domain-containing protein
MPTTHPGLAAVDVRAVMASGLVSCPPYAALGDVAALMSAHEVHAVVVDPGTPRLVTARDLIRAALTGVATAAEADVGTTPSVAPGDTLQAAAEQMVSFDVAAVVAGHEPRTARIVRPAPAIPLISNGRLAHHTVREVMHNGLIACPGTAPLAEVAAALVERRAHTVMVGYQDRWAFVSDMDVVAAALRGDATPIASEMIGIEARTIAADDTLDTAARLLVATPVGHAVVMSPDGFPVGVVSTLDLVGVLATG